MRLDIDQPTTARKYKPMKTLRYKNPFFAGMNAMSATQY